MGLECTRPSSDLMSKHHAQKSTSFQSTLRGLEESLQFQVKIENVSLTNFSKNIYCIRFRVDNYFNVMFPLSDFYLQENLMKSTKRHYDQFAIHGYQLDDKIVLISLEDREGRLLECLKIKLLNLCTGPYHYDHLLKQLRSRLTFDFYIEQLLTVQLHCDHLQIGFQIETPSTFSYSSAIILQNTEKEVETTKATNLDVSQKLQTKLKNSELQDSIIKVTVLESVKPNFQEYQKAVTNWETFNCIFIPYSHLSHSHSMKIVERNGLSYESRTIIIQENLAKEGSKSLPVSLNLSLEVSKLYTEQMDCVVLSENGIMAVHSKKIQKKLSTHMDIDLESGERASRKLIDQLEIIHERMQKTSEKREKNKFKEKEKEELEKMMISLRECLSEYENADKHNNISSPEVSNLQLALTKLLLLLSQLFFEAEEEETLNEYIWKSINKLLNQEVLSLRFINAITDVQVKNTISINYYNFILILLGKIITFTKNGITFKELKFLQKFIAFSYFRLPWCQEIVISSLQRKDDPTLNQQKLSQIGASYNVRSPSKSFAYDWEIHIFNKVKKEPECLGAMKELMRIHEANGEWAQLLFNRDYEDLFYGLYIELWNEAEATLTYNSKIMWEYFPNYGALLSIFLGEMNNNRIVDYSSQFIKCSMKLIKNEKLLNTFLALLFPKTCLYETYCVMKCLDLVKCYFEVIHENKKKLPVQFHLNYFYSGIRSIFESNHSYLVVKTLNIIYKYYHIFSQEFTKTLNHFILNKIFNQLFLHWCQNVRKIFHLLLFFKILSNPVCKTVDNPEHGNISLTEDCDQDKKHKFINNLENIQIKHRYESILDFLNFKLKKMHANLENHKRQPKMEYYQQMKAKLNVRKNARNSQFYKKQPSIEKYLENNSDIHLLRKHSVMNELLDEDFSIKSSRKWSFENQEGWSEESLPPYSHEISALEMKYLLAGLNEFESIKSEKNPDLRVEETSKFLQQNSEE